jgi:hypothetical protein
MLRDGAVRETGSHDELMAVPDGAYRRMVELQHGANILTEEAEVAAVKQLNVCRGNFAHRIVSVLTVLMH